MSRVLPKMENMEPSKLTQKELRELRAMGLGLRSRSAFVDYSEDAEEEVFEEKKVPAGVKRRRPSSGERKPRRKASSSPPRKKYKIHKPERQEKEMAVTATSKLSKDMKITPTVAAAPTAFVKVHQFPAEEIKEAEAAARTKHEAKLYKLFNKIHDCTNEHKLLEVLFVVSVCGKFEMTKKGEVEFSLGDLCRPCIKKIKKIMKY